MSRVPLNCSKPPSPVTAVLPATVILRSVSVVPVAGALKMPPPNLALLPEKVAFAHGGGALVVESAAVRVGGVRGKGAACDRERVAHGVPETAAGLGRVGVEETAPHRHCAGGVAGIAIVDAAAVSPMPGAAPVPAAPVALDVMMLPVSVRLPPLAMPPPLPPLPQ